MALRPLALAALCATLPSCSGERWLIGEVLDAGAGAATASDAAANVDCPADTSEGIPAVIPPPVISDQHLGTWLAPLLGAESPAFPEGPLQLELARQAATLRFASREPLPALSDASAGYLCTDSVESCASEAGFVSGFDYTLVDVRARGGILSLGVYPDEPWREWCQQQTPIAILRPGCEPSYGVEAAYDEARRGGSCAVRRDQEWQTIACDRLATVERGVCACTAEGCRATARLQPLHLSLVDPGALEGALWFAGDRALVLLFAKQQ